MSKSDDLISRQDIKYHTQLEAMGNGQYEEVEVAYKNDIESLPSADEERLTDDDIETIKIHLSAIKERLCNQRRWGEAEEYERLIERFMAFVSAEPKMGRWINRHIIYANATIDLKVCSECRYEFSYDAETGVSDANYCPMCGAKMRGEEE